MFNGRMKFFKKPFMAVSALLSVACVFVSSGTGNAYAQTPLPGDIPEDAVSYTIIWPDGSNETFTDYKDAIKTYEDDNEKLLDTFTTDEQGKIILKGYADSGTIILYEKVVPEGYTAEPYVIIYPPAP